MEQFQFTSCVSGYHIYKVMWNPSVGEDFNCAREEDNPEDPYAVGVMYNDGVVGHVPRVISAACSLFLRRLGTITYTITGSRRYSSDLPQGGLKLPCKYTFSGDDVVLRKVAKLLTAQKSKPATMPATDSEPPPEKKVKIEVVNVDDGIENSPAMCTWLYNFGIQLFDSDRSILQSERLSDNHMDFAQEILKQQFPSILGLHSTLLVSAGCCSRYAMTKTSLFLQIVYSKTCKHWIAVTARGEDSSVVVYDSLFASIEDETRKLCEKMVWPKKSGDWIVCTTRRGYRLWCIRYSFLCGYCSQQRTIFFCCAKTKTASY